MSLYTNIKKRRKELGMSQEELAQKMGYSHKSMISKIEAGKVDLTQSKIVEFAKVLCIDAGDLMGWEEPKDYSIYIKALEDNPLLVEMIDNAKHVSDERLKLIISMLKEMR